MAKILLCRCWKPHLCENAEILKVVKQSLLRRGSVRFLESDTHWIKLGESEGKWRQVPLTVVWYRKDKRQHLANMVLSQKLLVQPHSGGFYRLDAGTAVACIKVETYDRLVADLLKLLQN